MKSVYILIFSILGFLLFMYTIWFLTKPRSDDLLVKSFDKIDYYKNMIRILSPTYTQKINIPVYFINLPRSKDRLKTIKHQIDIYNISDVHIEEAVDGSNILPTENPNVFKVDTILFANNDPDISPGEIGCTLSHLKTIIKCLDSDAEYSLICEDDADFLPLFVSDNSLENVINNAPEDWDWISIYKACDTYKDTDTKYIPYYNKYGKCWGCVVYIINKKGSRKIANQCYKNGMFILDTNYLKDLDMISSVGAVCAADTYIQFFLNAYVYHDSLVSVQNNHNGMESTIHNSHTVSHIKRSTAILRDYYQTLLKKV